MEKYFTQGISNLYFSFYTVSGNGLVASAIHKAKGCYGLRGLMIFTDFLTHCFFPVLFRLESAFVSMPRFLYSLWRYCNFDHLQNVKRLFSKGPWKIKTHLFVGQRRGNFVSRGDQREGLHVNWKNTKTRISLPLLSQLFLKYAYTVDVFIHQYVHKNISDGTLPILLNF